MNRSLKRSLSAILALLILVSAIGLSVFADNSYAGPKYSYYTALGDSIASGYGLDAYGSHTGDQVHDGYVVKGSFTQLVGEAVGAQTINIRAHCAWRTADFLNEIGYAGYVDHTDEYSKYYRSSFFRNALDFISGASLNGEGNRIIDGIKNADLISVNFGTNDIFSFALTVTANKFSYILDRSGIDDGINGVSDLINTFNKLCELATENEYRGILLEFVNACETGAQMYKDNLPLVIDAVRQYNPNADIVVVGLSMPVKFAVRLGDKINIDPYLLGDMLVDRVNNYTENLCPCRDEYIFVDVTDTEYFGFDVLDKELLLKLDPDIKYSAVKMVHPTEAGHAFMAQRVLSALYGSSVTPNVTARYSSIIKRNTLNWTPIEGALRYKVYRSTSIDGSYTCIGTSDSDIYYDYLTLFGVTYYYKVCGVMSKDGEICTPLSEPVALKAR